MSEQRVKTCHPGTECRFDSGGSRGVAILVRRLCDILDKTFCCKTCVAAEPVSQCLRRAGCGGHVNNGDVNVRSDDRLKEKRSMKVGVT